MVKDVASNVGVDCAQGIVHEDNIGIKIDGSCNIDTLFLTTRDGNASLANLRLVTIRKHVEIGLESASAASLMLVTVADIGNSV
jgi:hypothetical protein